MPAKVDLIASYQHVQLAALWRYWTLLCGFTRVTSVYLAFCVVLLSARGMGLFYAHLALRVLLSLRKRIEVRITIVRAISLNRS